MRTTYALTQPCCAGFEQFLRDYLVRDRPTRVADLGGGANPLLDPACIHRFQLDYTVLDISQAELDKAPAGYRTVQADLAAPGFRWERPGFDLVFSRMLAEHVPDGARFHGNVWQLLAPGGLALHCFPTLYSLPFVFNRVISDRMSDWLLDRIQPRNRYQHAKFPAYYSWCRGPSPAQLRRFAALGYEVVEYRGLFGHSYFEAVPWLDRLQRRAAARRLQHPQPHRTSYAFIALRKPLPPPAPASARRFSADHAELVR